MSADSLNAMVQTTSEEHNRMAHGVSQGPVLSLNALIITMRCILHDEISLLLDDMHGLCTTEHHSE